MQQYSFFYLILPCEDQIACRQHCVVWVGTAVCFGALNSVLMLQWSQHSTRDALLCDHPCTFSYPGSSVAYYPVRSRASRRSPVRYSTLPSSDFTANPLWSHWLITNLQGRLVLPSWPHAVSEMQFPQGIRLALHGSGCCSPEETFPALSALWYWPRAQQSIIQGFIMRQFVLPERISASLKLTSPSFCFSFY